ncbi:MAG: O-antigen ligase family protein, partial [Candidatus Flexifilum sp.]
IILISSFIIFSSTDILNILLDRVPVLERLLNIEAANYSSGRIESWASVIQQIEARPLFGYGFGMDAIGELILSRRSSQDIGVHNSYLAITYQLGIIGLIMFAVPMVLFLARSILSTSRHRGEVFIYVLQAVVISGLVAAFFETWTHSVGNAFAFPFWMCVMLLVRTAYGEKVHQYAEAA